MKPPWEGVTKVYILVNCPGHMTKMAAMLIYGKNFKNLLLQNQKSYDLETWHAASVTQALQRFFINDEPGFNSLDQFYSNVKLGPGGLRGENGYKVTSLRKTCSKGLY